MAAQNYVIDNLPEIGAHYKIHEEYTLQDLQELCAPRGIAPKLILVGDPNVGKTCLSQRICRGSFQENYQATVGVQYLPLSCTINSHKFNLQVWDVAGQQQYQTITKQYYRGAQLVFACFSLIERETLTNLENWLKSLSEATGTIDAMFLVGCKSDLPQAVDDAAIQAFAESHHMEYWKTSAKSQSKTAELAKRAFFVACLSATRAAITVPKSEAAPTASAPAPAPVVDLTPAATTKEKKKCC
jgi:small GTP-binding protein